MNPGDEFAIVGALLGLLGIFLGISGAIAGAILVITGLRMRGLQWEFSDDIHKPGWYHDPYSAHSHQAYWDGTEWTGATRPDRSARLRVIFGLVILVIGVLLGLGLLAVSQF